ncbi:MAG: hypothetical protein KAJ79_02425 [Candidatus Omnitrophica bacterium]|nr:hypothetical protein [Candidatus Omnitrophota bacterium]MCK5287892.1 hypothetical protein [Candidatus Omnitrophota bacterium]
MALERRKISLLGKILVKSKKISLKELNDVLVIQKENPSRRLGDILIESGAITSDDLHNALALQFQYPYLNVSKYKFSKEILDIVPKEMAKRYKLLPMDKVKNILTIAMFNPLDEEALQVISELTGLEIRLFVASREELDEVIHSVYK